jgi:uncharacterized damage-inducible protein DinB
MNAKEMFDHWTGVRSGLNKALDQLTDEQLDFVPRQGMWSLGTVARHIAHAEEAWFRYWTKGLPEGPPEYTARDYPTIPSIKALLTDVHARTEAYLETLNVADLEDTFETVWGQTGTIRWVVWHVLEHEIHHRGEIYHMIGMLGLEALDV